MRCSVYCPERIDNLRADGWSCRCLLAQEILSVGQPTIYTGECIISAPDQRRILRRHIEAVISCLGEMACEIDAAEAAEVVGTTTGEAV